MLTWSQTLKEEHRLRMLQNRFLRKFHFLEKEANMIVTLLYIISFGSLCFDIFAVYWIN